MNKHLGDRRIALSCPQCHHPFARDQVFPGRCEHCGFEVDELHGVPVLRQLEPKEVIDYTADASLPQFDSSALLSAYPFLHEAYHSNGLILELGAGCDSCQDPNLVKTDAYLYSKGLDYVVDAHGLPFADNTFDYCFSLAVFEHLHSPWIAASEIHRVLKPGGKVLVLTAFMQRVHGYPSHFFNMTEMGLRRIFDRYDILSSGPSPHTPLDQIAIILLEVLGMIDQTLGEDAYRRAAEDRKQALERLRAELNACAGQPTQGERLPEMLQQALGIIDATLGVNAAQRAAHAKQPALQRLHADLVSVIKGLSELSPDIIAAQHDIAHWSNIAPGIEIIARK